MACDSCLKFPWTAVAYNIKLLTITDPFPYAISNPSHAALPAE